MALSSSECQTFSGMARPNPFPELGERAQHLFKALVERYIHEGQPVGSRSLSRDSDLNLSPATIRNVMADLEDYGLLTAPHTSAGRIPTVSGYRLFVDSLLTVQPLEAAVIQQLRRDFEQFEDEESLLVAASRLLSGLTRMAGVVTLPRRPRKLAFRHIEFLPLSQGRVLVILVTNQQEVHNRIIQPPRAFSPAELQSAANYLNALCEGRDLADIRANVLNDLQDTKDRMDQEVLNAAEIARLALAEKNTGTPREDMLLSGETNLMTFAELSSLERLRDLFEAFNRKRDIVNLLDRCLEAEGVQIFIGEESGYKPLDSCSLVTASYGVGGSAMGVLGVIGPTRMEYERVIPLVDITARLLGAALNQQTAPI